MFKKKKKPVTIITGYLGSGKTTVLNELLKNTTSSRIALIINDMGSINIDASLIKHSTVCENNLDMVELSNGCICCTLQDSFMEQINKLAMQKNVDRIVVEASGISDPSSIAAGFVEYQNLGLCNQAYLDSIVCVVDADRIYSEFLNDLTESDEVQTDQDPDIINLVIDQIEFCNVILLNKCDLLSPTQVEKVRCAIRTLQKEADIFECIQGNVNPDKIFQSKPFHYEKVLQSSRIQEQFLHGKGNAIEDEHGITSFLFIQRKPFDYDKFMDFLEKDYPEEIIRAKGYMWFSDDPIHVQLFEQAGRNASVTIVSNWLAGFNGKERQKQLEKNPDAVVDWDDQYGDRINQIVFIGKRLNQTQITNRLLECISTE